MKRVRLEAALVAALALGEAGLAQQFFSIAAPGPYRAGEWIALELDLESASQVREIAVHAQGAAAPIVAFRSSAERSVPPASFPLRLEEHGRYDVRFDGRVVQRIELYVRASGPWPARTWVPDGKKPVPRAWWELGAWNAAYAPLAHDDALARALDCVRVDRLLPDAPLVLGELPARWVLRELELGHLIFGLLCAAGALSLGLPRRMRTGLCIAGGVAATVAQVASPAAFWPPMEAAIVWTARQGDDGSWSYFADELRCGSGALLLDDETWIEPLAGGEIHDLRAETRGWLVRHRGGALRRWLPPALSGSRSPRLPPDRVFEAERGAAYRGLRYEGLVELASPANEPEAPPRSVSAEQSSAAHRSRSALLEALVRAYALSGVRRHEVVQPFLVAPGEWDAGSPPWIARLLFETLLASARRMDRPAPNPLLHVRAQWYPLIGAPEDPFQAPRAPRFLRVLSRAANE